MKRMLIISAAVVLPVFFSFGQIPLRPRPPQGGGLPPRGERQKEELKARLEAEPAGAPAADLTVEEFQLKRNDLKGQVVELTFDKVVSLKQAGAEGYIAMVTYESPRAMKGVAIVIPAEGLEFFEEQSKIDYRSKQTVYVQVISATTVKALGTRYRKNEPEGERYGW